MAKANKMTDPVPKYRRTFTCAAVTVILAALFAVRLHIEHLTGKSLTVFAHTSGLTADWFLYCKELLIFCAACGILLYAAGERVFPDNPCRVNPLYTKQARFPAVCIGGYLLLTVLSAVFSENREVVWQGNTAEFEGVMGITGCCVLFFFGYNYVSEKRCLTYFRRALTVLCAVTAVLAVIDYAFVMLMELPFMKYLIAPAEYRDMAASLKSRDTFREAVLMFYNSNYAGAFFVLVFPVTFYGLCTAKTLPKRLCAGLLCAGVLCAGIMTNATAAFYLIAAEYLVLTVYFLVKRVLPVQAVCAVIAAFAVLTLALDFAADGAFLDTLRKNTVNEGSYSAGSTVYRLKNAELRGQSVYIAGKDSGYLFTPPYESGDSLTVTPDAGTECTVSQPDFAHLTVHDAQTDTDIAAKVEEGVLYLDLGFKHTVDFAVTTAGLQLIGQNGALFPEIPSAPMNDTDLTRFYSFATGRGYIWLNSLPMLKKCILLGLGAGNFPFYFVQNDVTGMCNTNGTYHLVIDKAHSMYLQIAAASGIPALLLVLCLFAVFAFRGLRLAIAETRPADDRIFIICLWTGLCGFMVSGIVNDSCVTVNPLFWLCLGTAYCLTGRKEGTA